MLFEKILFIQVNEIFSTVLIKKTTGPFLDQFSSKYEFSINKLLIFEFNEFCMKRNAPLKPEHILASVFLIIRLAPRNNKFEISGN